MKTYETLNINENVTVILSKSGAKFLNKLHKEKNAEYKLNLKRNYLEGDKFTLQLWLLFKIFDSQLDPCLKSPFMDNVIGIDPNKLIKARITK